MLQHIVTGIVAKSVVHAFEMVDVEHQQRCMLAGALHAVGFLRQRLHEAAAIVRAGERVVKRHVTQFVLQLHAVGHVEHEAAPKRGARMPGNG